MPTAPPQPTTHSQSSRRILWLFLEQENPFSLVRATRLTEREFFEVTSYELIEQAFLPAFAKGFRGVDLSSIEVAIWVPKAPLSIAEVNPFKPQWAKKRLRVFLDDTVDYKSSLLTMNEILGSEELDCKLVHLIFTRAPRIPGQSEEGTRLVPNIPLIKGLRQRGSIPFTDYGSGKMMTFRYLRPLTLYDEAPFLVKLESDKMAVVKSVSRYGLGAHQSLADAGRAPQLLFFGSLDTQEDLRRSSGEETKAAYGSHLGLQRITVIMEYINGEHAEALRADEWPKDTYAQVKEMVEILHRSDFVFGDLRPPNIVFQEGRAYLVDFDWAGKEGESFYPAELGEVITGCSGAKGLGPIKKEHDLALLERYFNQM